LLTGWLAAWLKERAWGAKRTCLRQRHPCLVFQFSSARSPPGWLLDLLAGACCQPPVSKPAGSQQARPAPASQVFQARSQASSLLPPATMSSAIQYKKAIRNARIVEAPSAASS